MPTRVQLPNGNIGEFPDGMTAQQIESVLQKEFPAPSKPDPSGRTPTGEAAPGDPRTGFQRALDNLTTRDPRREEWQGTAHTGIDAAARGVAEMATPLISHPIQSGIGIAKSIGHALANPQGPSGVAGAMAEPMIEGAVKDYQENGPGYALPHIGGQIVGGAATGELGGEALKTIPKAGSAIRTAAIGDPDAAALRGLRVGPGSPKTISTIRSVQGSRPFLQGAQSLEDLQSKIPAAKNEIWGPYKQAVDSLSGKKVMGPDGPTTVGELEAERQQLSAINRELKSKTPNPEAVQLAQQKGLNQAQMLAREKAVQRALDPELTKAGIDPQAIRRTFGQVADVGSKVSGKSTLAEKPQPYGFSKLKDVSLTKPLSNIPLAGDIVRDVAAGRYLSAKPTDVALREAFRPGVAKPDLGEFHSPYLLGSGDELGRPHITPPGAQVTPAPQSFRGLPAVASAGDAQPMLKYGTPYVEPEPQGIRPPVPPSRLALPSVASDAEPQNFAIMRPKPPQGEITRIMPSRLERLQQQGNPLPSSTQGLKLPAPDVPTPVLQDTTAHVYPAGSAYRGLQPETPFYPPASAFRPKAGAADFDLDEYLRTHP